jgi:hypothetical protein
MNQKTISQIHLDHLQPIRITLPTKDLKSENSTELIEDAGNMSTRSRTERTRSSSMSVSGEVRFIGIVDKAGVKNPKCASFLNSARDSKA